jgi:hypothetical protein
MTRRRSLLVPITLAAVAVFAIGLCCALASFGFAALGGAR